MRSKIVSRIYNNPVNIAFIFFILVLSFWTLVSVFLGKLSAELSGDEVDYVRRATALLDIGWFALADAYRPPLYPIILGFLKYTVNENQLIPAGRILNIASVALLSSIWLYFGIKKRGVNKFLIAAFLIALWPQFYYFSFQLYAESISFLGLGFLILIAATTSDKECKDISWHTVVFIAFIISFLFLLKANNVLVAIPIGLFFLFTLDINLKDKIFKLFVMTFLVILISSPWFIYVKNHTGMVKATTTSGMNLLVGTGYTSLGMEPDKKALTYTFIEKRHILKSTEIGDVALTNESLEILLNLHNEKKQINPFTQENVNWYSFYEKETMDIAKNIWKENTLEQVIYGFVKIFHSFGGSLRGVTDYITLGIFFISIALSIVIFFDKFNRRFVYLHWGITFFGALLIYFFLPNIRFKTFYFDMSFLLLLAISIESFIDKIRSIRK